MSRSDTAVEAVRKLKEIKKKAIQNAIESLEKSSKEILSSSDFDVPVDTGFLVSSGFVKKIKNGFSIGYSAPYAARIHEDTTLVLKSGRNKFLQASFIRLSSSILSEITKAVKS